MKIKPQKSFPRAALLLAAGLGAAAASALAGQNNPVDRISNPDALVFTDVSVGPGGFTEAFVRDGVLVTPERFSAIVPGLPQEQVRARLGNPLREQDGKRGREWDYNFKFALAPSSNFIVCQYKVVFDDTQHVVREQVWRRRQCQQLVQAGSSSASPAAAPASPQSS